MKTYIKVLKERETILKEAIQISNFFYKRLPFRQRDKQQIENVLDYIQSLIKEAENG